MTIPIPDHVAQVPDWLTRWADQLDANARLSSSLLRDLGRILGDALGRGSAAPSPTVTAGDPDSGRTAEQLAQLAATDVEHNPYAMGETWAPVEVQVIDPPDRGGWGTLVDRPAVVELPDDETVPPSSPGPTCGAVKEFDRWVVRTDRPSHHPGDCQGQCCWRLEHETAECTLEAHGLDTMHAGQNSQGINCYWSSEAHAGTIVATPAGAPTGEPCGSVGPFTARCVAPVGHAGPCWAPSRTSGRTTWDQLATGTTAPDPVTS